MNTPVMTIEPSASLRAASQALSGGRVGTVVVVDGSDVLGILSERDIVHAVAEGADPDEVAVASAMSRDPRYLTSGEDATAAIDVMLAAGIRHLPVFEEGELIGMISIRDLLGALPS